MKHTWVVVLALLAAPSLFADAGQQLIPAGSLVSCTTGDARISSKTTAVGDPILCKVQYRHGDFMLPYGSFLGGEFSEYKDPGHFVGKGWMELQFDRLYAGGTVIPVDAKVVGVPGYKIDAQGRILGKGHAVRDTITWMIPILWPIDLINLPRRGPRPTLKVETALTLRLMEDVEVPNTQEPQRDPYGLIPRGGESYAPEPPAPAPQPEPAPEPSYSYAPPPLPPPPVMAYAPPVYVAPVPVMVAPPLPFGFYGGVVLAPGVGAYYGPRLYGPGIYGRAAYGPRVGYGYGYAGRVGVGYRGGYVGGYRGAYAGGFAGGYHGGYAGGFRGGR
jgi:hypothetical protein